MRNAAIAAPPLLREGDRLTSTEFLRRWEAMPDLKHAELIAGVVFMPSPVGSSHALAVNAVSAWLYSYVVLTPGTEAGSDATWIMGPDDVPQPDASLRILPEYGGQSHEAGNFWSGAPELLVEVSASTLSKDLGVKLELYRNAGVREYLTVMLRPKQIVWRELVRGKYREIEADESDGLLKSRIFPGLWLEPDAVWNRRKSIRTAVERGAKSPEHASFVARLAKPRRR